MHYCYSNLLRSAVLESVRSPWSLLPLPARQRVHVSSESRSGLPSGVSLMRQLHVSVMGSAMNIVGQSGVVRYAPDTPQATWTRLEHHPCRRTASNTSQYSGSGGGSQPPAGGIFPPYWVVYFLPVASHCWPGAAGSRARWEWPSPGHSPLGKERSSGPGKSRCASSSRRCSLRRLSSLAA
jgi:hypothetical protein